MQDNSTGLGRNLSRRRFIQSSSAVTVAALAAGGIQVTAAQTPTAGVTGEAPVLAEQVAAGSLPPLAERVPANPMVLAPIEEVGQYGGRIRRAMTTAQDSNSFMPLTRAALLEWSLDQQYNVVPSLAESFTVNEDATLYTFTLREGLKWSDGAPFTTDDLMFYFSDILGNEEYTVAFPNWLVAAGENAVFNQVDPLTLEIQYAQPMGLLPRYLCFSGWQLLAPKHYLSQFHPAYADQAAIDAAIAETGTETWTEMFAVKASLFTNAELPAMGAFIMTGPISGGGTRATATRNPYYWKVDPEGNQLPYIDEITFDVVDQSALVLKAAAGEIDLQMRFLTFTEVPVLQGGAEETGTFEVLQWQSDAPWVGNMYMNQSHLDPVIRELMQNVDFRAGISHAINREEINQVLYLGLAGTQHPCAIPQDPYYVEGYGYRFTEFNVDTANQLLDQAGLTERDGDGFRLRPDGEGLSLTVLTFETNIDAYELIKGYLETVGIRLAIDAVDRTLWAERVQGNDVDIAGYTVAGLLWDIDPLWYVPVNQSTYWAPGFGTHFATGGESGEAPSEIVVELQNLYGQMVATSDDAERVALGQQILGIHDQNVFMVGAVTAPFQPIVVNTQLGNVFRECVASYRAHNEGVTAFEQVFYRGA